MATDNIGLVRQVIDEVWNKGKTNVLSKLVADGFIGREPLVTELRGPNGLKAHVEMMRTAFPDLHIAVNDIGASGDRVFVRWTARGTHRGAMMGIPASNASGEIHGISVYRVAQGQVVEHHSAFDSLALMQLIGAVPPMDRMAKRPGTQPSAAH